MIGRIEKTVLDSPDPAGQTRVTRSRSTSTSGWTTSTQAVLALGATRLPNDHEDGFRVLTDPAGQPFCLVYG